MKIIEKRGAEMPSQFEVRRNGGQLQVIINRHIRQENANDVNGMDGQWVWDSILMPIGVIDYGSIVSAIINHEYPYDRMEAVRNNHDCGTHIEEWEAMQEFRVEAKKMARTIVDYINANMED